MNWNQKTRSLLSSATGGRIAIREFERIFPQLANQIRSDANSSCFRHWGHSFNFDEHEQCSIVDRKILTLVGKLAKHSIRDGQRYHAGLIHTYGYLLSNLKTRYGYKRERWTNGLLGQALGIPDGTMLGKDKQSTLLQNATFLMARVAFDNQRFAKVDKQLKSVSDDLRSLNLAKLSVERIEEKSSNNSPCLITDLVKFKKNSPLDYLLVYSFKFHKQQLLITCFPTSKESATELLRLSIQDNEAIRPRYNLALPDFPEYANKPTRKITRRKLR